MLMNLNALTAVVIGEGSLPIRCAELLLNRGWTIEAVVSLDPNVVNWAKGKGLTGFQVKGSAELKSCLGDLEFGYLFSVVNSLLLKQEIIDLAQRQAVNYHDALLPRYAGLNASTWALINGEKGHGISWHALTAGVDEGDILVPVPVEIAPDDTSLNLNLKCYEAAICGFETLIDQLEQGEVSPKPQDLSQRTYYAGWTRPWAGGFLDFEQQAEQLSYLVRGLSFGSGYLNSVTLPKLWLGDRWVVVETLSIRDSRSEAQPGQVLAVDEQCLVVSTASNDVALSGFQGRDGDRLDLDALGLAVGQHLPRLSQPEVLQSLYETVARHEGFWSKRLKKSESLKLTWMESSFSGAEGVRSTQAIQTWPLAEGLRQGLMALAQPHCTDAQNETHQAFALGVTTALGAYFARLSDEGYGDLAFSGPEQRTITCQAEAALGRGAELFSPLVPMQIRPNLEAPVAEALAKLAKERVILAKRGGYATDLLMRDPDLAAVPQLPIAVTWRDREPESGAEHMAEAGECWPQGQLLNLVIEGQQCHWQYDSSRLTAEAVTYLAAQLESFMGGLIKQPERPLCHQPLVTLEERQRVLLDWNQTQADYDWSCCVHNLIEAQALAHPERIALEFKQQRLTYSELNQQANQIAHELIQRGVKENDRVGIHVDRSLEMIVALLGVLKAGGAYLPLDPSYPRDRLQLMVEDAEPKVLLTQRALLGNLPHDCELCLDDAELWESQPQSNPAVEVLPEHLAYIIYTSGSTGRPKGVMIEHGSLTNLSKAVTRDYHIGEDVVLEFASISFDMAVEEIYPCLVSGGRLVVRSQEMIQSVPGFLAECEDRGVTVLSLPTAYWHLMVAELNANHSLRMPDAVRVVLIGGEAANPRRVVQWQQMCHRTGFRTSLLNTYGPTEGTVDSTFYQFELPSLAELEGPIATSVPIGYPISNVTNYVLDRYQQPVPVGCVGELCVGGAGVARGYLHRPDLTAERFIPDPFSRVPGAKLYRTGDLVRHRADGAIDYLGRLDHQVKIRGFRIELGEIEALLAQQPTVEDVVVIAREDKPGQKRLVAYVVPKDGLEIMSEQLRQALGEKLPEYMVPTAFVVLASLPMTPNEKVDRKALPMSTITPKNCEPGRPLTEQEQDLCTLWENLLGLEGIQADSNFFELGGDSLTALRLLGQIEQKMDIRLTVVSLFQAPTLEALAQLLQRQGAEEDRNETMLMPLKSNGEKPPFFFINSISFGSMLAPRLGEDYPLYGINMFGATEGLLALPDLSLKAMARRGVDDLQVLQPHGPYYLGGYCDNSKLAFEMAQCLEARGETVALLAFLDATWAEDVNTWDSHFQNLRQFGPSYIGVKIRAKSKQVREQMQLKLQQLQSSWKQAKGQSSTELGRDILLLKQYNRLMDEHQPDSVFQGAVDCFICSELRISSVPLVEPFVLDGVRMHTVTGYHHTMFESPHVENLARQLEAAIDRAAVPPKLKPEPVA